MPSRNLVLSYVEDYSARDVAPFVETLRRSGYDGDVVFYTSNLKADCSPLFLKHRVREIPVVRFDLKGAYTFEGPFARAMGLERRPILPDITINRRLSTTIARLNLGDTAAGRFVARYLWHCLSARFVYFRSYLRRHAEYDTVLISDVRDVVFQTNPFAAPSKTGLHVFEEYGGVPLGEQQNNASWIRNLYGPETLAELAHYPIICAGVLLAERQVLLDVLDLLCREVVTRYRGWGTDQGALNYLVRKERLRNVAVHSFGHGSAMHVGIAPRSAISTDVEGRVLTKDGTVCSIIHQYDRHEDVRRALPFQSDSKLSPTDTPQPV